MQSRCFGVAASVDGDDVFLQVSGVEVADLRVAAFLVGKGNDFSGRVVVVAQGLVSSLFREENAVIVVGNDSAVYSLNVALAVKMINIADNSFFASDCIHFSAPTPSQVKPLWQMEIRSSKAPYPSLLPENLFYFLRDISPGYFD